MGRDNILTTYLQIAVLNDRDGAGAAIFELELSISRSLSMRIYIVLFRFRVSTNFEIGVDCPLSLARQSFNLRSLVMASQFPRVGILSSND